MQTQRTLTAKLLGAALVMASALGWSQPYSPTQDNSVKQDVKAAGHDTKDAAKDTGHAVRTGTVKAAHATAHGTKKVWKKTKSTTKGAVHGAKEGAEKPAN